LGSLARRDALRQALIFHAQSNQVGFGCGELSDPIAQAQHPEDGRIYAQSNGRVSVFDASQCGTTDLRPFSHHGGREAPASAAALNIRSELLQLAADRDRQKRGRARHATKVYIISTMSNSGNDMSR
jgi:hypothetical protein